ncbi:MAG: type II secretion system F family protein [Peptococcaceae bacterium]|jgi:tight adherence protein B|nr:type II secretion system F family protein [Peptococcaceae bacterium]
MPAVWIAAAVYLAVLFFLLGAGPLGARPSLKEKLAGYAFREGGETNEAVRNSVFRNLGRFLPGGYLARQEASLRQAEIQLYPAEFLATQIVVAIAVAGLVSLFNFWFALVAGLLAAFSLNVLVEVKKRARQALFDEQLIEALSIMTGSVKAGYSLPQAMKMVVEEMDDPIKTVFANFMNDMSMGVTMEEGLENMARQANNADMELMCTAIGINRQVGGNISEILELIQATVIERIKLKRNIKTLTAQGRLSGAIISVLPLAIGLIIFLVDPPYIEELFTNKAGLLMLAASALMMTFGILVIRSILEVKA